VSGIHEVGGDLHGALEDVSVPTYLVDRTGIIRWINPAAERLFGNVVGRQNTSVVAPEESRRAREAFARKLAGTEKVTDESVVLIGAGGERVQVEISAVALIEDHRFVGVFGQISDVEEEEVQPPPAHLTPRQVEVLRFLQRGASTEQIAQELHLSTQTVRNHIRHLLSALGVHTRLEAVAVASGALRADD
jgi:PAS domain S-box-containing protein